MISREQLQSIEWAIKDEDGGSWCPACASPADIGHKCDCWLARALAAPPADAGAHKTGPQPTACGGAAAMPISGSRTPGMTEAAKLRDDAGVSAEGVTAGETALSADAGAPEREPRCKMRHRMDGAIYICTREVDHPGEHRSGSARSWPADAGAPPDLVALVQRQVELLGQCEAFIAEQFDAGDGDAVALSNSIHAIRKTLEAGTTPAPSAAPPALVALVQEWQASDTALDADMSHLAVRRWQDALTALKAWSPAPAPVAPPADAVARVRAIAKESARLLDETADRFISMGEAFAPPAVAGGGDAMPEIRVGDDVTANSFPDVYNVSDSELATYWNTLQRGRVDSIKRVIWRRRQEGQ